MEFKGGVLVKSVYDRLGCLEVDESTVDATTEKETLLVDIDGLESDLLVAEHELRTLNNKFESLNISKIKSTIEKLVKDMNEIRGKLY
jgi:hypothetical protein